MRRLAPLFIVLVAFLAGCGGQARRTLIVGVDDDAVKWTASPFARAAIYHDLGLDAVRLTLPWRLGQQRLDSLQQTYVARISGLARRGVRTVLAVYGAPADAPATVAEANDYCAFVSRALRRAPLVRDVVIWNEANNARFWPRRLGAAGYERLLARCWDRLHALRRPVNVIDSTAPHQRPARFLAELGSAYRRSGRERPLVDTFGHNGYPQSSAEPPSARHGGGPLDEGDYESLLRVLRSAFGGTAQPLPGEGQTTIWYLETGFETLVPGLRSPQYHGRELGTPVRAYGGAGGPAGTPDQADQLAAALRLAYCQPAVGAFFNFELADEHRREGWQSGVLWAGGSRKPAYGALRRTIAAVRAGTVDCAAFPRSG